MNYDESPDESPGTSNWHVPDSSSDKSKVYNAKESDAWDQNTERLFEDNPTWEDVSWLKDAACGDLPLVVKGIMTAEDAIAAVNAGAGKCGHSQDGLSILCLSMALLHARQHHGLKSWR